MPTISFANPKGGIGKTTAALLRASELAEAKAGVTIIDADPEKWNSQWAKLPGKPDSTMLTSRPAVRSFIGAAAASTSITFRLCRKRTF